MPSVIKIEHRTARESPGFQSWQNSPFRDDHSLADILTIEPTTGDRRHTICVNLRGEPWDSSRVTPPSGLSSSTPPVSAPPPIPPRFRNLTKREPMLFYRSIGTLSPLSFADSEKYQLHPLDDLHRASGGGGGGGGDGDGAANRDLIPVIPLARTHTALAIAMSFSWCREGHQSRQCSA